MKYRGRFAPSPTGPLHMGSLVTALASYLDARTHQGEWLVRIEDLDPPREKPGAAENILSDLIAHGLHWDNEVLFQSKRLKAYQSALDDLIKLSNVFCCTCIRKELNKDGTCSCDCYSRQINLNQKFALRFNRTKKTGLQINDFILGPQVWKNQDVPRDFILRRKDGLFSYQLAVVVDDEWQAITHIMRGSDLLGSTPKQIEIISALSFTEPKYGHLPTITNLQGLKLSKQTMAPSIDSNQAVENLRHALVLLGQPQPTNLHKTPAEILRSAIECWNRNSVPKLKYLPSTRQVNY